jgi:hypothetical protein
MSEVNMDKLIERIRSKLKIYQANYEKAKAESDENENLQYITDGALELITSTVDELTAAKKAKKNASNSKVAGNKKRSRKSRHRVRKTRKN